MAYVCSQGTAALCWDSSICNELSSEERLLNCIHICTSVLSSLALESNEENLSSVLTLATLTAQKEFLESVLQARNEDRRSYSMEHFRWGKPPGRKRRPVKVYASSLEGGESYEGSFPQQVRRQLGSVEKEGEGDLDVPMLENQELQGERFTTQPGSLVSPQERKDGTYQMSHFRWGSPPAAKRYSNFMKPWEEKPQKPQLRFFRNA
ncbi:pro-opiomelanocortin-like [Polymixia lowei]